MITTEATDVWFDESDCECCGGTMTIAGWQSEDNGEWTPIRVCRKCGAEQWLTPMTEVCAVCGRVLLVVDGKLVCCLKSCERYGVPGYSR